MAKHSAKKDVRSLMAYNGLQASSVDELSTEASPRRLRLMRAARLAAALLVGAAGLALLVCSWRSGNPSAVTDGTPGLLDRRSAVGLAVARDSVEVLLGGLKAHADKGTAKAAEERTAAKQTDRVKALFEGLKPHAAEKAKAGDQRAKAEQLAAKAKKADTTAAKVASAAGESLQLRTAACTLNVLQASNYLARAGMQIDQATKTCQPPALVGYSGPYKERACAANAAGIFSSVAWVATYLSLAASQCGRTANVPAVCAGTIEGIVAALGGVAVQANFVAANCGATAEADTAESTHTDAIWQMAGRRLGNMNTKYRADRDAELATCVLDVTEAATSLAQMGLNIRSAERGCTVWKATDKIPVVNKNTHAICSLDIGHVLFSVGQAATFIAAATSHCAEGINVQALCASGVAGLLSTLAGVVYLGSGVNLACNELPRLGPLENPVGELLGQGIVRRLAMNETEQPLI